MIISAPLQLSNCSSPSEFDVATISPIDAPFIAAIVVVKFVTLEKFIAFPLMLMLDEAVDASLLVKATVTRL